MGCSTWLHHYYRSIIPKIGIHVYWLQLSWQLEKPPSHNQQQPLLFSKLKVRLLLVFGCGVMQRQSLVAVCLE
jgi:hypothetical protein